MIQEILSNHYHTLADQAEQCGINWNELQNSMTFDGRKIKHNRIANNPKSRGKVFAVGHKFTARDGKEYPTIVFYTNRHGGITEVFNGFREHMANRGYSDAYIKQNEPKVTIQPPKQEPKTNWKINRFQNAEKAFKSGSSDAVIEHHYADKKGFNAAISCDLEIVRATFEGHDVLMTQIRNIKNAVIGYQVVHAEKFDGKRDKDFIGETSRGFEIIGGSIQDVIERGATFVEGIATGAACYYFDGSNPRMITPPPPNGTTESKRGKASYAPAQLGNCEYLPVVICYSAAQMAHVFDDFVIEGMNPDNARIAADNDCGKEHGNTGLFVAVKIAKKHGCKVFTPQPKGAINHFENLVFGVPHSLGIHESIDFADVAEFHDGAAICDSLVIPKNPTNYALDLLKIAPKNQLNKLGKYAALTISKERVPSQMSANSAINEVNAILLSRGADIKKIGVDRIINNHVRRRKENLKKLHTITRKLGINRIQFSEGEGNDDVAKFILEVSEGIFLDNRGLGAGKTKLLEVLRAALVTEYIAYVCHRISLTKDAAGRLNLLHYQDDDIAGDCHGAAICVNSIAKNHVAKRFNILFLDEFRQILEHVAKGTVENRQAVFDALCRAIELADLVICSDADLNDRCVEFLKKHAGNKTINLIETIEKPNTKTLKIYKNFDVLRANMNEFSDENQIIACTSREVSKQNEKYLGAKKSHAESLLIHSKNADDVLQAEFLANPNEFLKNHSTNFLIHSPTVGSGVSIEKEHFAINYLFDSGNLPANEKLQMLARNRMTNDYRVAFTRQRQFDRVTDLDLLTEGEGKKAAHYVDAIRVNDKTAYVANELGQLRIELTAERNDDLNDFANNFVLLAELKGMAIDYAEEEVAGEATIGEGNRYKNLKKEVQLETIERIFNAPVIDDKTAKEISNKSKKQADSDMTDRHLTTVIAGTTEITLDDVENIIYGKAIGQVANHEILSASIFDLRQWDKDNAITQNRTICKTSIHKLGNHVINELFKHERVDRKTAQKLCDYLNDNAAEIAANGLGNYTRKSKNPIRTIGTFIEKFGYELIGERIQTGKKREIVFELIPIDYVGRYVENRLNAKS